MRRSIKLFKNNEKGQALVEFALVLIPLTFLIMGILEFGWLFNGQITLTGAAREGARAAVVSEDIDAAETAATEAVLRHVATSSVTVVEDDVTVTDGVDGELLVAVQGNINPLVGFFVRNTFTLNADASMRKEFDIDFGEG